MNKAKKELLKKNNKVLQFLHDADGFDFTKPFIVLKGTGRFTFNSVTKEIQASITSNYKASLFIKIKNDSELYCVKIEKYKFNPLQKNVSWWNYRIDDFYGIGRFEEVRKNNVGNYYIVAQANEYIMPIKTEKPIDFTARFDYGKIPDIGKAGDGHGNSWINSITLTKTDGSAEKFEYRPYGRGYCSYDNKTNDINDIIDKSGYLILERRREIISMVDKIKTDKAKLEADKADYSRQENLIRNDIDYVKSEISKELIKSITSDEIFIVSGKMRILQCAIHEFECHLKNISEHRYYSVISITSVLDNIEKKLSEIKNTIDKNTI